MPEASPSRQKNQGRNKRDPSLAATTTSGQGATRGMPSGRRGHLLPPCQAQPGPRREREQSLFCSPSQKAGLPGVCPWSPMEAPALPTPSYSLALWRSSPITSPFQPQNWLSRAPLYQVSIWGPPLYVTGAEIPVEPLEMGCPVVPGQNSAGPWLLGANVRESCTHPLGPIPGTHADTPQCPLHQMAEDSFCGPCCPCLSRL